MAKIKNFEDSMTPFVFPQGTVRFSHLITPDTYEGKTQYKVEVVIDETNPEWKEVLENLKKFQDDRALANGKSTKDLSCVVRKDGLAFLKFHSNSNEFFSIVDKNNQPYDQEPWRGSTVRVFGKPEYYTGFGGGITLYLMKVQVVENAKDIGGGGSYDDPFAASAKPSAKVDVPGDDVPF
jgi:hypothetical protein